MLGPAWILAGALALPASAGQAPPPPPPAEERPIQHLFQNLGHDLVRLPSTETLMLLAAGSGLALATHPADDDLRAWVVEQGSTDYTAIGNVIGDGWLQGGAAVGTYVAGRLGGHRLTTHVGSDLIRAQVLNAVLTRAFKLAADRRRPYGGDDAMPSGHTSASFTSATVLHEHFGWKVGLPAYAVASLVGWSRIRDDQHWLTDTVMGATIGLVAGRTVVRGHRSQWIVVPTVSTSRAAVTFVRRSP